VPATTLPLGLDPRQKTLILPGARLVVLRGPDRSRALRLEREEVTIGSAPTADLQLSDSAVSRSHFTLRQTPEGYLATDLGSTNGTFVDGRRIREVYLRLGDKIELGRTRLRLEVARSPVELQLSEADSFGRFRGRSVAVRRMFSLLEKVAPQELGVLLLGETGTGKDTLAEALHDAGPRRGGPLVVVDCGAIAAGVIESELFGHEKGAFTGAAQARLGAFREAHGGTLFLDEIGELPRDLQPKLLRVIDKGEVRPLGAAAVERVDVRIIAATNRDLRREVNRGLFREDLFYRLGVVTITIPPLRERPEDIPLLATHFWRAFWNDPDAELPEEFLPTLLGYGWPGNVRELRNRVERAAVLDGRLEISGQERSSGDLFSVAKEAAVDRFERSFLSSLLQRTGWNIAEAARRADMDRTHLTKLLRKHGIHRPI
jgi:transcriptional regulator with GAF, ATPase, and Fis domain